jgi:hypothetical protein
MKTRILTLLGVATVIVVSVAFTMPKKQVVKSAPVAAQSDNNQTAGGFAIDNKD